MAKKSPPKKSPNSSSSSKAAGGRTSKSARAGTSGGKGAKPAAGSKPKPSPKAGAPGGKSASKPQASAKSAPKGASKPAPKGAPATVNGKGLSGKAAPAAGKRDPKLSTGGRKPLTIKPPMKTAAKAGANAPAGAAGDAGKGGAKGAAPAAKRAKKVLSPGKGQPITAGRTVAAAAAAAQPDAHGYVVINGRRVRSISTKGLPVKKKTRTPSVPQPSAQERADAIKAIKTKLDRKELAHYKSLLLIKRGELTGLVSSMEAEALRSSGGNLSHMPIHMADIGTDTYDQDFKLGMAETERQLIMEIDEALERIENKTYGVCQMTGKPIPKARLEAKPWAKYTIEAARLIESGRYGR